MAVDLLHEQGHNRIGMIVTQKYLLAVELGRRRFLEEMRRAGNAEAPVIAIPAWPHEDYERLATEQIAATHHPDGTLQFSALIVWGIESGKRFRDLLAERDIEVPRDLSVVLLGRTDLDNEHDGFFTTVGPKASDQITGLYEVITERWAAPDQPYRTILLEANIRSGETVTPPAK
jgi:DNA-binding LacI/PurR family transcriptional regulator